MAVGYAQIEQVRIVAADMVVGIASAICVAEIYSHARSENAVPVMESMVVVVWIRYARLPRSDRRAQSRACSSARQAACPWIVLASHHHHGALAIAAEEAEEQQDEDARLQDADEVASQKEEEESQERRTNAYGKVRPGRFSILQLHSSPPRLDD